MLVQQVHLTGKARRQYREATSLDVHPMPPEDGNCWSER